MLLGLIKRREITAHGDPYLLRYSSPLVKGYHFHIFLQGDPDPDCHDHPWDFHTFPLTPYLEEVWRDNKTSKAVVLAGRWSFRKADHTHRVIGPHWAPCGRDVICNSYNVITTRRHLAWYTRLCWWLFGPEKVVTIIKHGEATRKWGFRKLVNDEAGIRKVFVWVPWKEYVNKARTWMDM